MNRSIVWGVALSGAAMLGVCGLASMSKSRGAQRYVGKARRAMRRAEKKAEHVMSAVMQAFS